VSRLYDGSADTLVSGPLPVQKTPGAQRLGRLDVKTSKRASHEGGDVICSRIHDETLGDESAHLCAGHITGREVFASQRSMVIYKSMFGPVRRYLRAMDSICAHDRC
jgi:hypothetical protein